MDDNGRINRQFLEADDEEEACELLFNTYHKDVFAQISKMMRNHPDPAVDAEDIVQETFIKAFKERKTLREPEKVGQEPSSHKITPRKKHRPALIGILHR